MVHPLITIYSWFLLFLFAKLFKPFKTLFNGRSCRCLCDSPLHFHDENALNKIKFLFVYVFFISTIILLFYSAFEIFYFDSLFKSDFNFIFWFILLSFSFIGFVLCRKYFIKEFIESSKEK